MAHRGLGTIWDIVRGIALSTRAFKSEGCGDTMDLLRRNATAIGHFVRILAKYTTLESGFAFMGGLMHDVGIAGTLPALSAS
ncbi:MAG: HDOD domain-containing protein [Myxococcota bacterium]